MTFVKTQTAFERFADKVHHEPNSGCWLWAGSLSDEGYGTFHFEGRTVGAHRWAYEEYRGVIPAALCIDHLCRVRSCVNPDHLETVTNQENSQRGADAGTFGGGNGKKTQCANGHPFTPSNTHHYRQFNNKRARRICKMCKKAYDFRYRLKAREAAG